MGSFYSASEYDIANIVGYPGNVLELGRSCVDLRYRTGRPCSCCGAAFPPMCSSMRSR